MTKLRTESKLLKLILEYLMIIVITTVSKTNSAGLMSELKDILPKLDAVNNSFTDVRYNVGDSAFLPCHSSHYSEDNDVSDANISSVSWVRRRDFQILSAGVYTNTIDSRFTVLHREGSNDWTLQLKYLKLSDNGTYECQIHTDSENGFTSEFVNLHVYEPKAVIDGPEDLHVSTGHSFTLSCQIEQAIARPVYIIWLHRGIPLNYAPDRPRLTVSATTGSSTGSTLRIVDARYSDSGNYTCTSQNSASAVTMVYVSEGDNAAAIHRISSSQPSAYKYSTTLYAIVIAYSIINAYKLLSVNFLTLTLCT